jgi:hypothetical protein
VSNSPLSARTRALLEHAKADAPGARARQTALVALGAGVALSPKAAAAASLVSKSKVLVMSTVAKLVVGSAIVATATVAAGRLHESQAVEQRRAPTTVVASALRVHATLPATAKLPATANPPRIEPDKLPRAVELPVVRPSAPVVVSAAPVAAKIPEKLATTTPTAESVPSLTAQLELLHRAREALRGGDAATATHLAEQYVESYPSGAFLPEARRLIEKSKKE